MRRPPVLLLSGAEVAAAMPPVADRLALAERTMVALVADAELPSKIGVHPRPEGSFAHAMPALLRSADDAPEMLGLKWVTGFPDNAGRGLPAIAATVIVNDPSTGLPAAILDGGPITAQRTAAVSGVVIRQFATPGARRVALIGAGVQAHSHLEVLGVVLPGTELTVFDRHPERAAALATAAGATRGIAAARTAASTRAAVEGAEVVVTAVSFTTPDRRGPMTGDWLAPDTLIVPVDYASMCAASVARDAALFLVDDRGQFLAHRDAGEFDGYPGPTMTFGEAIIARTPRPPGGRVVAMHLGVGLADVVFADAIVRRAVERGIGTMWER